MLFSDIIALIIVYLYVVVIFLLAEKVLKSKPEVSRKFVHIMVGNMIFAMPFFSDPSILLWFITLPITIALFFLTEYSPITIHNSVTESGHALGLFFYAGIWSVLLLIFPILLDPNLLLLFLQYTVMDLQLLSVENGVESNITYSVEKKLLQVPLQCFL